jgi:hypothetical protein
VKIRERVNELICINAAGEEQRFLSMRAVRKIFIGVASSICFFTVRRRSQEGPFPENVYLAKRRYSSHLDRTRKFSATLLHCRAPGQDTPRSRLETWMTQRRAACSLP